MIIENRNGLTILYAEGTSKITNKKRTMFSDCIYLAKNDKVENYEEVPKDIWKNYIEIKDPDLEDCYVKGNLGNKCIVSIPYVSQLNKMCNLIDEEGINAMRFTIGDEYVIRTLGGSTSVLSPSLFNEYDLCEAEILTNLLRFTGGRFLCKGSRNMYFLVQKVHKIPVISVRGVTLTFDVKVELE